MCYDSLAAGNHEKVASFTDVSIYENHTQPYPQEGIENNTEQSSIINRFPALVTEFNDDKLTGRFAWIESIVDPVLVAKLKKLSSDDLELLTFMVIEGHSQGDCRIKKLHTLTLNENVQFLTFLYLFDTFHTTFSKRSIFLINIFDSTFL